MVFHDATIGRLAAEMIVGMMHAGSTRTREFSRVQHSEDRGVVFVHRRGGVGDIGGMVKGEVGGLVGRVVAGVSIAMVWR